MASAKFLKKKQLGKIVSYELGKRVLLQNSQKNRQNEIRMSRTCVPNTIVQRINDASLRLGLPENVKSRIIEIAQNIKDEPEFSQRKPSVVAGVIIYYACRYAGIRRTVEDVAAALGINPASISTGRNFIFKILKERELLPLLQQM